MSQQLIIVLLAVLVTGQVWAQKPRRPGTVSPMATIPTAAAATTTGPTITPSGNITFTATGNPDSVTSVNANQTVAVSFSINGSPSQTWTLGVSSSGSSFANDTNCSAIPASAVTVTCTSATLGGGAGGGTATCGAAVPLSTTSQTVASGKEPNATKTYTVNLSFAILNQWAYPGDSGCQLGITYTLTAP